MRVIIFGGDGFCGWPTSLHLSRKGHDVLIVDNLSRRKIDVELGTNSLTPILPISERLARWKQLSGRSIGFRDVNIARDYAELCDVITSFGPEAIVHFAEQRAAPYSMKSQRERRYTVDNNLNATNNVLSALVDVGQDIHLLHLGTMGVYGYAGVIPEGYLKLRGADGAVEREVLHPADPGSIYHMTKTQDALFFYYYNKNWKLRITDLHQGIVWGTNTDDTCMDEGLINRFDYDGDYGTVLNRFLVEAAVGHPLTVYGTGGQRRAFIHIRDTVRCVELAMLNPPEKGDRVQIFNQMTETHRLIDLANKIVELSGARIAYLPNPRKEATQNELTVNHDSFLKLGLEPVKLADGLLIEVTEIARKYKDNVNFRVIPPLSNWDSTPVEPALIDPGAVASGS